MNEDEIKKRIELAMAQYVKKESGFLSGKFESQIISQLSNEIYGSSHNCFKTRLIGWGLKNKEFIKRIPILSMVGRKFFRILIISSEIKTETLKKLIKKFLHQPG